MTEDRENLMGDLSVRDLLDLYEDVLDLANDVSDRVRPAVLNIASGIEQLRQAVAVEDHLERP